MVAQLLTKHRCATSDQRRGEKEGDAGNPQLTARVSTQVPIQIPRGTGVPRHSPARHITLAPQTIGGGKSLETLRNRWVFNHGSGPLGNRRRGRKDFPGSPGPVSALGRVGRGRPGGDEGPGHALFPFRCKGLCLPRRGIILPGRAHSCSQPHVLPDHRCPPGPPSSGHIPFPVRDRPLPSGPRLLTWGPGSRLCALDRTGSSSPTEASTPPPPEIPGFCVLCSDTWPRGGTRAPWAPQNDLCWLQGRGTPWGADVYRPPTSDLAEGLSSGKPLPIRWCSWVSWVWVPSGPAAKTTLGGTQPSLSEPRQRWLGSVFWGPCPTQHVHLALPGKP